MNQLKRTIEVVIIIINNAFVVKMLTENTNKMDGFLSKNQKYEEKKKIFSLTIINSKIKMFIIIHSFIYYTLFLFSNTLVVMQDGWCISICLD